MNTKIISAFCFLFLRFQIFLTPLSQLCNMHKGLAKAGVQSELQPFVLLINFGAVRQ
jgi:hypothetical protein